jgi:RNA polymerase sigma factor (sigma-70 family)
MTDEAMVAAVVARRPGAVRALVGHVEPAIRIQVTRVLLSDARGSGVRNLSAEVDDMVQEVLLILFKDDAAVLRKWDGRASIRTYVRRIAQRKAGNICRYWSSNPWYLVPVDDEALGRALRTEADAEDVVATEEVWTHAMARTFADLTARGQQIASFLYRDERTPTQISDMTGMSMAAVYKWQSRIQQTLRRHGRALLAEGTLETDP